MSVPLLEKNIITQKHRELEKYGAMLTCKPTPLICPNPNFDLFMSGSRPTVDCVFTKFGFGTLAQDIFLLEYRQTDTQMHSQTHR